jgi:hypothetical protein
MAKEKEKKVKLGLEVSAEVAEAVAYWTRRSGLSQHKLLRLLLELSVDELARRFPEEPKKLIPPSD